jgi:hypothetical protein
VLDDLVDNSMRKINPLAMVGSDQVIVYGLSNSLGAKNSRATFFHKFPHDSLFVFKIHVDGTPLPIHLQIPLAGVLSECSQSVLHC